MYMCTCMFNYLLGQLGMGTTITRNETKRSDEISKTNPHMVILWFQQHVIPYSQRNVIICNVVPFILFTVTVATLVF